VTLGSVGDAQKLDTLGPEDSKRFLLHYNFPPYSVGEVKRVGSPGRREIGHGALAEKALASVIPDEADFPYTIRVVCEALSSNGSTSMASVCAATIALMDAGVPIKTPVAGISVGLVSGEDGQYVTLTDIQGLEDHVGDMDFKVAGSTKGITAIQLDIKVKSIGLDVVSDALNQAREARIILLEHMNETIGEARSDLSDYAPRMIQLSIPVSKIGAVIGPGGKTIRGIVAETGATVDVQDDGTVTIGSTDSEASNKAVAMVENLTKEAKVGDIYIGKITRLANFGAFVEILPGKDGLVRSGELGDMENGVKVGQEVTVIVQEIDSMGRINLSLRTDEGKSSSQPRGDSEDRRPSNRGGFGDSRGHSGFRDDTRRRPRSGPRP
jgi:polyribonucleotide nucleotidyltransferase